MHLWEYLRVLGGIKDKELLEAFNGVSGGGPRGIHKVKWFSKEFKECHGASHGDSVKFIFFAGVFGAYRGLHEFLRG